MPMMMPDACDYIASIYAAVAALFSQCICIKVISTNCSKYTINNVWLRDTFVQW